MVDPKHAICLIADHDDAVTDATKYEGASAFYNERVEHAAIAIFVAIIGRPPDSIELRKIKGY